MSANAIATSIRPDGTLTRWAVWLLAIAGLNGLAGTTRAQPPPDRVWIEAVVTKDWDSWRPIATSQYTGKIVELDAEQLSLVDPEGRAIRLPGPRVQSVDFQWHSEQAAAASGLFEKRDYRAAIDQIPGVYTSLPRWQQRILLMQLVQSLEAIGLTRQAATIFLDIARDSPLPAFLYADMPLCWTAQTPDATLAQAAQQWLASDDDHARLLGASWLLFGSEHAAAEKTLLSLQASTHPVLASLAAVQSWRLLPPPETMQKIESWFAFRNQLLEPLQIGPTEFLADRLRRVGQTDLAIGQWMRIATLHADRYHRAADALVAASEQLQLSADDQAQRLQPWIARLRGH